MQNSVGRFGFASNPTLPQADDKNDITPVTPDSITKLLDGIAAGRVPVAPAIQKAVRLAKSNPDVYDQMIKDTYLVFNKNGVPLIAFPGANTGNNVAHRQLSNRQNPADLDSNAPITHLARENQGSEDDGYLKNRISFMVSQLPNAPLFIYCVFCVLAFFIWRLSMFLDKRARESRYQQMATQNAPHPSSMPAKPILNVANNENSKRHPVPFRRKAFQGSEKTTQPEVKIAM